MADRTASFDILCTTGRELLDSREPTKAHRSFAAWDERVANWLDEQFPNTGLSAEWSSVSFSTLVVAGRYSNDPEDWFAFNRAVQQRLRWLAQLGSAMKRQHAATKRPEKPILSNRVFVVHGHTEAIRDKVARFLTRLELQPVILHEQPNKGRTIIEKFTEYADVSFAVVLLTADDVGGLAGCSPKDLRPRARQNVIFELGYFVGRLGRECVCALYDNSVEILSDYAGVIYISIDAGGAWQLHLAKEMKAAGLPIDMNKVV